MKTVLKDLSLWRGVVKVPFRSGLLVPKIEFYLSILSERSEGLGASNFSQRLAALASQNLMP